MPPRGRTEAKVTLVIPGKGNEFNNRSGFRVAEALGRLGATAQVVTLGTVEAEARPDWVVFFSLAEVVFAHGDEADAVARIRRLLRAAGRSATWLLEPATTRWYRAAADLGRRLGVELLLDYSLHSQADLLPRRERAGYRHVRYGLTASERAAVPVRGPDAGRPLPWCIVGHRTPARVALVERLVRGYEPGGFAYLPELGPVTESGPHLGDEQVQRVLERSRLHVWCSHFTGFYLEAERFRRALLAGCLPVKVIATPPPAALRPVPFDYLLAPDDGLEGWLRGLDVSALWQRFAADYAAYPTLEAELAGVLGLPRPEAEVPCRAA